MSDEEEQLQCPYNPTHMVLKRRMPSHLIKCRNQHKVLKFATCPINATHDVPEPELQYHIKVCPDRRIIEKDMYVMEEPKPIDPASLAIEVPSCSENWDEDSVPGTSYLNVKDSIVEKNLVFRQPVGKSKSERRAFVKKEVRKFGEGGKPHGSGESPVTKKE